MPSDRKRKAKKKAQVQRSGKRLIKASTRATESAGKTFSASGGKKYAKHAAKTQTSANFEKEGKTRLATGEKTDKRKDLRVTPRSIRKADEAKDKRLKPQRKGAGRATTTRPKRKK